MKAQPEKGVAVKNLAGREAGDLFSPLPVQPEGAARPGAERGTGGAAVEAEKKKLLQRLVDALGSLSMLDVLCDPDVEAF